MLSTLAKLVAAKALVAVTASAAVGGVALAAATGSLPAPAQQAAHDVAGAPAPDADKNDSKTDDATESSTDSSAATPSPNLVGLCRAYGAGVADSHGKALDNPAFTVLVTAAGGKTGVAAYCTALLAANPTGKSATAGKPDAGTHGKPATTGKPATVGKPATPGKPAVPGKSTTHP